MKFSKTQIAFAALAGSVVIFTGYAARTASIHHQNCLSYERQSTAIGTAAVTEGEKAGVILQQVNANPFSGLVFIGELVAISQKVRNLKTQANNIRYAYVKSCTQSRADKFSETPENQELLKRAEALEKLAN